MNDLQKSAARKAVDNRNLLTRVNKQYGGILQKYAGDIPRMLLAAHILDVNPNLTETLSADKTYRKGFCRASVAEARNVGIKESKLDDLDTAAYVLCLELNHESLTLYTEKQSYFSNPNADFWKSVYLLHRIGEYGFSQLWNNGTIEPNNVYASLLDSASNLNKTIIPWSFTEFNYLVFFNCEYVTQLASAYGKIQSPAFGKAPVLTGLQALKTIAG